NYFAMRYMRLPLTRSLVTLRPNFFLSAPEIAPRTLWCCHPVAFERSSIVAPVFLRSISMTRAIFDPLRCGSCDGLVPLTFDLAFAAGMARFDLTATAFLASTPVRGACAALAESGA